IGVEEILRDAARRAGIHLALQVLQLQPRRGGIRMAFGIAADADLEVVQLAQAGDQVGRIGIAVGMRHEFSGALRRVAAQGDDMPDAGLPVMFGHLVDLASRGADAGQMRRRAQAGFLQDADHGVVGALAGRAAGAIGDRDEARIERRQAQHAAPQAFLHLRRLGREELEGDLQRPGTPRGIGIAVGECHAASLSRDGRRATACLRACQMWTVSGWPGSASTGSVCSDAASHQARSSASAKPSRRWAWRARSSSRSWGAKSTITSRPPGFSTRAASAIAFCGSSAKCRTWWITAASMLPESIGRAYMSAWRT